MNSVAEFGYIGHLASSAREGWHMKATAAALIIACTGMAQAETPIFSAYVCFSPSGAPQQTLLFVTSESGELLFPFREPVETIGGVRSWMGDLGMPAHLNKNGTLIQIGDDAVLQSSCRDVSPSIRDLLVTVVTDHPDRFGVSGLAFGRPEELSREAAEQEREIARLKTLLETYQTSNAQLLKRLCERGDQSSCRD